MRIPFSTVMTACNNFNKWQFVGMSVAFTHGLNDTALYFKNVLKDGYAFLDITDNLCTQINTTYNINIVKNIFFSVPYTILKILLLNILPILFSL